MSNLLQTMKKAGHARLFAIQDLHPGQLGKLIAQVRPKRLIVAVSGGRDSQVLAHLCWRLSVTGRLSIPIELWHVNHKLQPDAESWARDVAALAAGYGFLYRSMRVDIARDQNVEQAAREARYQAFSHYAESGDLLLLGQHRDDQEETLMLRLMRGAGPQGLAAMSALRTAVLPNDGKVFWGRPLLGISRRQIDHYASAWQLVAVEDPSNHDVTFDRNFLRQQVLPALRQRWPQLGQSLSASANACAEVSVLLEELAKEDLIKCAWDELSGTLSLELLRQLSVSRQKNLLRHLVSLLALPPMPEHLVEAFPAFVAAEHDTANELRWKQFKWCRFHGSLYLLPALMPAGLASVQPLEVLTATELPWGKLVFRAVEGGGIHERWVSQLHLIPRQSSLRWQPPGKPHHVTLKNYFQQRSIPVWLRQYVPIVAIANDIVSVADEVADRYRAGEGQRGWLPQWVLPLRPWRIAAPLG
ncbi:tRNA lysidine(34) synthetase TilS [Pokkaliibacter sp. CJK22405]|uniref:tRNA lysidine(34) synthetase TilS n=1 Tax=Pokkaliibacter sp. CJK22405 TaxID=3384615 RepID=UPI0039855CCA